jgi:ribosomal protein L36
MSQPTSNHPLAIVIPAYKGDFLAKALAGLARQTDQRFNIYIGDDASPDDIAGIARVALGNRPYVLKRFEKNLGGQSLTKHWMRCVEMSSEPWFWLFSDDNCVAAIHAMLAADANAADLMRFDAWIVDGTDRVTGLHAQNLDCETGLEFAYGLLMGWRRSFVQQLVIRRTAFNRMGGYLEQPLGWSTDDAAIIALGWDKPVLRIPDARIRWRCSDKNISPDRSLVRRKRTILAICQFLEWLDTRLQSPRAEIFPGDGRAFRLAMDRYLVEQVMVQGGRPALANWQRLKQIRARLGVGSSLALMKYVAAALAVDTITTVGDFVKKFAGKNHD